MDFNGNYMSDSKVDIVGKCIRLMVSTKSPIINYSKIKEFVKAVINIGYLRTNAYHNHMHAYEVLENVTYMARFTDLSPENVFLLQIAALCHDIDHLGIKNSDRYPPEFIKYNSYDSITEISSSSSYNEYDHIQFTTNLLTHHKNIFKSKQRDMDDMLNTINCLIMSTDLSLHQHYTEFIKKRLFLSQSLEKESFSFAKMILMLKLADVGHIVFRNFNIHLGWVLKRYQEEGDDFADIAEVAQDTVGFVNGFVDSLVNIFHILHPEFEAPIETYNRNISIWKTYAQNKTCGEKKQPIGSSVVGTPLCA